MRGFLVSLISVALIAVLFMFSNALNSNYISMERAIAAPQPVTYAAFIFDEVGDDVNAIVGPSISFSETNDSIGLLIADSVPGDNFTDELADYESFLEDEVADAAHAAIDINLTNLSSLDVGVVLNEEYEYRSDQQEMLFTSSGGTGAVSYDINISVFKTRGNITTFTFDPGGDMEVSLRYTDSNGTIVENGRLHSDAPNTFTATYEGGGSLDVTVGLKSGEDGSLSIRPQDAEAYFSWHVLLPKPDADKRIGFEYDAVMNYSQANIRMTRKIGK